MEISVGGLRRKYLKRREEAHKALYKGALGKDLNLEPPCDFNEKLQWLTINYYGKKEGRLADKENVKKYVRDLKIPYLMVTRTLKTYKKAEDINLDELPEKFVLKCNHFSGDVFICKDKANFDLDTAKNKLNEILAKDFSKINLEYHYHYIKPLIMAEEYLDDGQHKNPIDYKFYCFNGKPESILVCSNRDKELKLNDFDLEWNELDYTLAKYRAKEILKKPKNLQKMIEIVEKLAKDMPFARVDLYEIGDKIYFGEYTFVPGAGIIYYYKQKALDHLGGKLRLENFKKQHKLW